VLPQHLESFLPQLHSFVSSTGAKLAQEERVQVYEAIAHVISAMNMNRAAQSLRTFALDILATIHAASKSEIATKEEFKESCCG
jgi:transportin-3